MLTPLALAASLAFGATGASPPLAPVPLTLVDVPEAARLPGRVPTWEQSLDVTGALLTSAHLGVHWLFDGRPDRDALSRALEVLALVGVDLAAVTLPLPFTTPWLHEEGHRAAMGAGGLDSRQAFDNLLYPEAQQCDSGSVCGLTDDAIAAVRSRRPADWVRVQAAGMESELELMRRMERDAFFSGQPPGLHAASAWLLLGSVEFYRSACAGDVFTEADVRAESPVQAQRDFTGPDCTGWVSDLFRPREPYAARGPHPNGDGLRRARLPSDLTTEERASLVRMRNLGLLNFADPALFGFPRFRLGAGSGRPVDITASLHHDLTAFGDALGARALVQAPDLQVMATVRVYRNRELVLPGVAVSLLRRPVRWGRVTGFVSTTAEAWLQPEGFEFSTHAATPGGALELSGLLPVDSRLEVFVTVRAKSAGWRPVDPSLDATWNLRWGVNLLLPVGRR